MFTLSRHHATAIGDKDGLVNVFTQFAFLNAQNNCGYHKIFSYVGIEPELRKEAW